MENLKFTKGEWIFTEHEAGDMTHTVRRIDSNGTCVCVIRTNNQEQAEANAKLIAAAPELLEALIKAKETISKLLSFSEFPNEDRKQYYNFIDTAINKATK